MFSNSSKIKKFLAIVFVIVLLLSFTQSFIYVDYLSYHYNVYAFTLIGPIITLGGGLFYVISLFKNEYHKSIYSLLVLIFSYVYTTFYIIGNYIFVKSSGVTDLSNALYGKPKVGLFLYFVSMIIILVDYFIVDPYKKAERKNKMAESVVDIQDQCILGYYKRGLNKKFDEPTGNFSVLVIQKDAKKIEYCVYMPISIREKILEENIISINIKKKIGVLPTKITEDEKTSVIAFLFKKMGAFIASNKLLEYIDDYVKKQVLEVYQIEIIYYDEKQERKIVFVSKNDPSEVLKNINISKNMI